MRLVFYHSTNFPQVGGRDAGKLFLPITKVLEEDYGCDTMIATPKGYKGCTGVQFSHAEEFVRTMICEKPDAVFLWTSKQDEREIGRILSRYNIKCLYSELGWWPHYGSVYFDADGCGPESWLTKATEDDINQGLAVASLEEKVFIAPLPSNTGKKWMPIGIVGQINSDWAVQNSAFEGNQQFFTAAMELFGDDDILYRPHPGEPFAPKESKRVKVHDPSLPLAEFFGKVKAVAGINSSALLDSVANGKITYMGSTGVGWASGAFVTKPLMVEDLSQSDIAGYRRSGANLIHLLKNHVQIDLSSEESVKRDVKNNLVLQQTLGQK